MHERERRGEREGDRGEGGREEDRHDRVRAKRFEYARKWIFATGNLPYMRTLASTCMPDPTTVRLHIHARGGGGGEGGEEDVEEDSA